MSEECQVLQLLLFWSEWPLLPYSPVVDEPTPKAKRYIGGNSEKEGVERQNLLFELFQPLVNQPLLLRRQFFSGTLGISDTVVREGR